MLIRNGIDHRMIDPMELASVLPVAGSVIGTADDKGISPAFIPAVKQPPKLCIRIAKCGCMALKAVAYSAFQIKIIRIMNCIYI